MWIRNNNHTQNLDRCYKNILKHVLTNKMYIIYIFHIDPQNKRQSIPHHIQNGKESFFFVLRVYEEVEVVPKVWLELQPYSASRHDGAHHYQRWAEQRRKTRWKLCRLNIVRVHQGYLYIRWIRIVPVSYHIRRRDSLPSKSCIPIYSAPRLRLIQSIHYTQSIFLQIQTTYGVEQLGCRHAVLCSTFFAQCLSSVLNENIIYPQSTQ